MGHRDPPGSAASARAHAEELLARVEELATVRERNRLAGEIHDTLAHTLTTLTVQIDACRRLLRQAADARYRVLSMLDEAEQVARQGAQEVRRSVRALRPELLETCPLDQAIAELTRGLAERSGIAFRLDLAPVGPLDGPRQTALFRVVQEAVTNSVRHGNPPEIGIRLAMRDNRIDVEWRTTDAERRRCARASACAAWWRISG